MKCSLVSSVVVALGVACLMAGSAFGEVAGKSYKWTLGSAKDVDPKSDAYFTDASRVGKEGAEGQIKFRKLAPDVFQNVLFMPAFDFDPKDGSINAPFYLTVKFKDVAPRENPQSHKTPAPQPFTIYAGKGGSGFYGAATVGFVGGAADEQWKEETIIIRRSMMRSQDGKHFRFTLNNIKGEFPVESLLLFSANATDVPDKDARIAAAVALEKSRHDALLKKLLPKFNNLGYPDPGVAPELTDQEKKNGVRVFFPPLSRGLYPNAEPRAEELAAPLKLYACPGQTQTVLVGLKALKDLGNVSVKFGDLEAQPAGPELQGVTIVPSGSTVRWAKYSEKRSGQSWGFDYRVRFDQLVQQPANVVTPERLELAAVRFTTPIAARPGEYKFSVNVTCEKGNALKVPVQLTVYPFKLEHPDYGTHGQFYYISYGDVSPIELMDMRDHGMDTMVAGLAPQWLKDAKGVPLNAGNVADAYKLLKTLGYRSPIISDVGNTASYVTRGDKERKQFKDLVACSKKLAEDNGFEAHFFSVDEPHTKDKQQLAKVMCEAIKEIPGAKTFITSNPDFVKNVGKPGVLDDICWNLSYINEHSVAATKAAKQTMMFYCPSFTETPSGVRFWTGFYYLKSGAQAIYQFAYFELEQDPFCDLDGGNRDWNVVYPSLNSATHDPTLNWEATREGVNDYQYAYTLQTWADKADKAGKKDVAAKARKALADLLAQVDIDGKKAGGPAISIEANTALSGTKLDPEQLKKAQDLMSERWYDESRQKLAAAIAECKKAVEGK